MTVLNNIGSGFNRSTINSNFDIIEDELNNDVLKRNNPSADNSMRVPLDMNSNPIHNLPAPVSKLSPARLQDLEDALLGNGQGELFPPVAVVRENFTLIAGQTVVAFANIIASTCSVYISGEGSDNGRLHEGIHYTVSAELSITLIGSYASGTVLTAYSFGLDTVATIATAEIDTKTETLTLASAQVLVRFAEVVTSFASIYVNSASSDNGRLHLGQDYVLRPDVDSFSIELNTSYPAGTKITGYSFGFVSRGVVFTEEKKLEVIAHRGFLDSFPQNTMLAFTSAIRRGADSLECDVQITSDGVPVVFHDTVVSALTNGSGTVASLTLSQVQALIIDEVASTAYSGTRIPTFAELLNYCKSAGIKLYPEVKQYRTQTDISIMIQAVVDADMEFQTFFSSFSLSDVQYFKTLNNDILCGLLGSSSNSAVYEPLIDTLAALGNTSIVWQDAAIITSPDIVTYARARGVDVQSWTIVSNTRAKELMKLGVYKIITDRKLEVL
jgi:glycerophosphoryl diester phosphodiesterase